MNQTDISVFDLISFEREIEWSQMSQQKYRFPGLLFLLEDLLVFLSFSCYPKAFQQSLTTIWVISAIYIINKYLPASALKRRVTQIIYSSFYY